MDLNSFINAYIEAALWSTPDDMGYPVAERFDSAHLNDTALKTIREDCAKFCKQQAEELAYLDARQCGHDFWLTRNGHGAGFWDRGLGERGKRLSAAAHAFGEQNLVVGDDGKLYLE